MKLGEISGCHQMPERSFFIKGKQFPVCARCTGAFIGYFFGAVAFMWLKVPVILCLLLCAVMFVDWFIQYRGLLESNNVRRLITGALCGFGLVQLYFRVILYVVTLIKNAVI